MPALRNAIATLRRPAQRSVWVDDAGNYTPLSELYEGRTAQQRRLERSNADLVAIYGAVFAAVRKRSQAAAKGQLVLLRRVRGGEPEEITDHPALDALARVNEALTAKQGLALIEQHKLLSGAAYWVKRRDRLGVPREFDIWDPERVEVKPRDDKPWAPLAFRLHKANGSVDSVGPADMVWFRYMIDPRNPLYGLTPVGAVRMEVDTGLEALRFNQRFFDNDALPAAILGAKDAGPAEVGRIEDTLERKFKGTDNKHRLFVTEGDLSVVTVPMAHKDMEFILQHRMTKEDVAMVFEMSPVFLGDQSQATKENLEGFNTEFWLMMLNELENTAAELTEFYVRPDFGDDLEIAVKLDVPALQPDKLLQAQIDEINLRTAKTVINELRTRDGEEPVAWGDVPIVSTTLAPLDARSPEDKDAAALAMAEANRPAEPAPAGEPMPEDRTPAPEPPRSYLRSLVSAENDMRRGWERRLARELRAIVAHLEAEAEAPGRHQRILEEADVDAYDWDWWLRYGPQVMAELAAVYEAGLLSEGFQPTPLLPTHELAVRFAERRGAELLRLDGRDNVVAFTRERVRTVVADGLEKGESIDTISKRLREDFGYSSSRAETIARTETAMAHGDASLKAYSSNGYEGKRWLTAGDDRVDANGKSTPCLDAEADGPIPLSQPFSNGRMTVPAHPRCRCRILPIVELPRD